MPPFCTVANKFLCDFFFPPRSCSPPNEPTGSRDGRARTPLRATPSASPTGLAARRRRGRAHPGQGREAGARSRPGPLPGVGSWGLNRLWALLLCGLELSATPAHAHAACLFLTSSPRPQLSSPGKRGPACRLWRRAGQGLPNACAELKWRRDGASHWAGRRGCERPLGSGPIAQARSLAGRGRGPAEPPQVGETRRARPASFGAVVPVPWNRWVRLKVE